MITLISGCFDGFDGPHAGHRFILTKMREIADYVVVALNSDAYLRRKGPNRPIMSFEARRAALYRTGLVDEVIGIEDTPIEVIKMIQPRFIVVGRNDYELDEVVGAKECASWGGEVIFIREDLGISTTKIIEETIPT